MKIHALADSTAASTPADQCELPAKGIVLRVLGTFNLTVNERSIPLGMTSQRLLTLVVVRSGQIARSQAAGILWPETRASRAAANLRSALWRLQQTCCGVIDASFHDLQLACDVAVDFHLVSEVSVSLLDRSVDMAPHRLMTALRCNLYEDLAPDIGDCDWLTAERERFRQLRVHALEALADQLIAVRWYGAAVEAALGAIRADQFRENAYQLLVTALLAEGSRFEARRQYFAYCELLRNELGLAPSEEFMALMNERGHGAAGQNGRAGTVEPDPSQAPVKRDYRIAREFE